MTRREAVYDVSSLCPLTVGDHTISLVAASSGSELV